MVKYLFPRIAAADMPAVLSVTVLGAFVAGVYGAVHDQITFAISAEYFTKMKFTQFHYADLGLGDRVFVSTIGFLATGAVGLVVGWFLARRFVPHQPRADAYRQIGSGFACVFVSALLLALLGYAYGLWRGPDADFVMWISAIDKFQIADTWSFVRVAYIHNAGYVGGAMGLIVAMATIRPDRQESTSSSDPLNPPVE